MPEIPDIEVFAKNVKLKFAGKRVLAINIINGKKLKDSAEELALNIENRILEDVYRSGKEFRFKFSGGTILGMHLMLTGDLFYFESINKNKFTIVEFHFEDGSGLALTDLMRNANIKLDPQDKNGVDALSKDLTTRYLKKILSKRSNIKNILLDQNLVRGIGNGYSDDILWVARISPFSLASAIPDSKIKELAKAIKHVLVNAINNISQAHPGLINGEAKEFLLVHRKEISPTGEIVEVVKNGSRKTYYTKEQELYI